MAVWTVKTQRELGYKFVLAPERYDPRRALAGYGSTPDEGTLLGDLVQLVRRTVNPSAGTQRYLLLDTSHAQGGVLLSPKAVVTGEMIGSAKKMVQAHDVIISRLRPYLRQVAFVDADLRDWSAEVQLLCSTEFFVLRAADGRSLAFLIPFLLSAPVQQVLAAAQEGGHHPRFNESTLLRLPVPSALLQQRNEMSAAVESSVSLYRESERTLARLIKEAEPLLAASNGQV